MKRDRHPVHMPWCLVLMTGFGMLFVPTLDAQHIATTKASGQKKVLGLDTVIAFYDEPRDVRSATFVRSGDWKHWEDRGGVAASGLTWFNVLKNPVEKGADILVNAVDTKNPRPVVNIDEFGFDFDGQIDLKTAEVLRAAKKKKPELGVTVWQMRGPVAPRLAATYRELVDLVLMETYVDLSDSWLIAFQLQAARLNGLLEKSIIGLGLGAESKELGGHPWTRTREELEQQLRLIRFVAPESPGVAFFGLWGLDKHPLKRQQVDELSGQFRKIPTDGTGLRPELLELGKTFTKRYAKPAIFCSSTFVMPNFYPGHVGPDGKWTNWGQVVQPESARAILMNLGEQDAKEVIVRLRGRGKEGEVWAKGLVDVPARSLVVATLPTLPGTGFRGWAGTEQIEVNAPGAEVHIFQVARFGK